MQLQLSPALAARRVQAFGEPASGFLPPPPAGLALWDTLLVALEARPSPWLAHVASLAPGQVPSYRLGDFAFTWRHRSRSDDGHRWSEVANTPGFGLPAFLPPPELSGLAKPSPGAWLRWPAVAGAHRYTMSLRRADGTEALLWEGAVARPEAPLPQGWSAEGPLRLELHAWQSAGLGMRALAQVPGPRSLHLPTELPEGSGAHSWAWIEW